MSKNEGKKFLKKTYMPHQYEEEAAMISEMRAQGWKFVKLHKGIPTKYEFESCKPEKYVYQIDFVSTDEDTPEYHQLFKDAGWKEIYKWPGMGGIWYYFERIDDGSVQKIYTDNDSKIELTNKLLRNYGVFCLFLGICNLRNVMECVNRVIDAVNGARFGILSILISIIAVLACVLVVFSLYMTISLCISKKKLKLKSKKAF